MLAVGSVFSDRTSALLTVQTVVSELASLHLGAERFEAASSTVLMNIEKLQNMAGAMCIGGKGSVRSSSLARKLFLICSLFQNLKMFSIQTMLIVLRTWMGCIT
ncbi:hypothetical protein C5167_036922 [Papaver somniferum]|uniref:Uncharacterized protein n=1 Tax=Papaver somniferum TaxID=3469 RepID=A0A4Y7I818_PAPSO|nr:hypothetical protein C5167_036922 [Papaver somniferum]